MALTSVSIRADGDFFVIKNCTTLREETVRWESLSSTFPEIATRSDCIRILIAFVLDKGPYVPLITLGAENLITKVVGNAKKHF